MVKLSGNRRAVYQQLRLIDGPVSFGTLACLVGCHRRTVIRAVQQMTAAGLLRRVRTGERRPNLYELII